MLLESLKIIDIFAPEIKLNIDGKKGLKTYAGAFLTMFYVAIMGLVTTYVSLSYINKEKPMTMSTSFSTAKYHEIDLVSNKLLPLITTLNGATSLTVDEVPKYITIQMMQTKWNFTEGRTAGVRTERELKVVPCMSLSEAEWANYEYVKDDVIIQNFVRSYSYCISSIPDMTVSGKSSDETYVQIVIRVKPCILGSQCKSASELSQLNIFLGVPETNFNLSNQENPYKFNVNLEKQFSIIPESSQLYFANLQLNQVMDYLGFIPSWELRAEFFDYKNVITSSRKRLDSYLTCSASNLNNSRTCPSYIEFTIRSSSIVNQVNRRYKTLSETFGEIGGLNAIVFLAFGFFYLLYHQFVLDALILNQVYGALFSSPNIPALTSSRKTRPSSVAKNEASRWPTKTPHSRPERNRESERSPDRRCTTA